MLSGSNDQATPAAPEDRFNADWHSHKRFILVEDSPAQTQQRADLSDSNEAQMRKHRIVKLIIAAPEDQGIALLGRLQCRLHPRLDVRLDADFNSQDASLRKAPLVVFGQALEAFDAGSGYRVFALIADDQGRHQLAAIDRGIEHQIPTLAALRNQSANDLHAASCVLTESVAGLAMSGEVRCLDNDDAMTRAVVHAMGGQ